MHDLKQSLTPAAYAMQEKVIKPIKTFDKRKWLLISILIPLLILLLIAIAYSESNPHIHYRPNNQNNQKNQNNQNSQNKQTIHNNEFIIKFQEKSSSFSSSHTFRRNK
jgi:hypothetical protein